MTQYKRGIMNNPYKYLGLEGEQLLIKFRYDKNNSPLPDLSTWTGFWIPVFVEKEYPKFLVCEVLEHKNPAGQRKSKPYRITLHKHDMARGLITIKQYMGGLK